MLQCVLLGAKFAPLLLNDGHKKTCRDSDNSPIIDTATLSCPQSLPQVLLLLLLLTRLPR